MYFSLNQGCGAGWLEPEYCKWHPGVLRNSNCETLVKVQKSPRYSSLPFGHYFSDFKTSSNRPVIRGGETPLENISPPLENCVGHSLKLLDIV